MSQELPPSLTLAWVTDIHLDSADNKAYEQLVKRLREQEPHALLISGDIANGQCVFSFLKTLHSDVGAPIYFVFGNHDFWGTSISQQRQQARSFTAANPAIVYLSTSGVISLTPKTALVGHDGWGDAKEGNYLISPLALKDYFYIQELLGLRPKQRQRVLNALGEQAAERLGLNLAKALADFQKVIVITHVPPFREACLYRGQAANDEWAPHYVCQSVGQRLLEVAQQWPEREILVLCGHSHHEADFHPLPNLRILVGHAEYHDPQPQDPLILNQTEEFQ